MGRDEYGNTEFFMAGTFDGSEPASRWLKRLDYDLRRESHAGYLAKFLLAADMLMVGTAADWAETDPTVNMIFSAKKNASLDDVTDFKILITSRFGLEPGSLSLDQGIALLSQGDDSLLTYYHRAMVLLRVACEMKHVGRSAMCGLEHLLVPRSDSVQEAFQGIAMDPANAALQHAYLAKLDQILHAFVNGLKHSSARIAANVVLSYTWRTLSQIYTHVDKCICNDDSNEVSQEVTMAASNQPSATPASTSSNYFVGFVYDTGSQEDEDEEEDEED